jgi:tetratricopeptide (TPR) repeat protein
MDETQLFQLIAEGENERIDFKRTLDLDSALGKAEFVKDIISLANSAADAGYLLIGIENNGTIVGAGNLEEERIQQIANTYIDPPVTLRCWVIPTSNLLTANVVEVRAARKPHKTVRAIEKLNQNEVFVRHGSVVVKASPDEIIGLSRTTQAFIDVHQYVRAAVRHVELRNFDNAIKAYSAAIDLAPTAELFLARGRIYLRILREHTSSTDPNPSFSTSAYKDFSDAISLSTTEELEKDGRLGRARIYTMRSRSNFDKNIWLQDTEWLKQHAQDQDLGEALFLGIIERDNQVGSSKHPVDVISGLDHVLHLGYDEPEVFGHRAWINYYYLYNYGLALEDINQALEKSELRSDVDLVLKGHILMKMGRFKEAYLSFDEGRRIGKWDICPYDYGWVYSSAFELEILQRFGLQQEFHDNMEESDLQSILRIAAFNQKYELRGLMDNGSLTAYIMFAAGKNFWVQLSNISGFAIQWYDTNKRQLPIS